MFAVRPRVLFSISASFLGNVDDKEQKKKYQRGRTQWTPLPSVVLRILNAREGEAAGLYGNLRGRFGAQDCWHGLGSPCAMCEADIPFRMTGCTKYMATL